MRYSYRSSFHNTLSDLNHVPITVATTKASLPTRSTSVSPRTHLPKRHRLEAQTPFFTTTSADSHAATLAILMIYLPYILPSTRGERFHIRFVDSITDGLCQSGCITL